MKFNTFLSGWIPKGWGGEQIIDNRPEYCGKILYIMAGKRVSWHYHIKKTETFHLLEGKLEILLSDDNDINTAHRRIMKPGDTLYIYPGLRHRMIGLENSKLLEVSTQDFPDDSIRVEKGD